MSVPYRRKQYFLQAGCCVLQSLLFWGPGPKRNFLLRHAALTVKGKQHNLPKYTMHFQYLLEVGTLRSHPLSSLHSAPHQDLQSQRKRCFNRKNLMMCESSSSWQIFLSPWGSFTKIRHISKLLCNNLNKIIVKFTILKHVRHLSITIPTSLPKPGMGMSSSITAHISCQ